MVQIVSTYYLVSYYITCRNGYLRNYSIRVCSIDDVFAVCYRLSNKPNLFSLKSFRYDRFSDGSVLCTPIKLIAYEE